MVNSCIWCTNQIEENDRENISNLELNICSNCETVLNMVQVPIDQMIESYKLPIVIINHEHTVISANQAANRLLKKFILLPSDQNIKIGNLLRCPNAEMEEGCGKTSQCGSCQIRHAIQDTITSRKSETIVETEIINPNIYDKNNIKKKLKLSLQKAGKGLLIKLNN